MSDRDMGAGAGILAIWNDCAPGSEELYEDWYIGEHLPERVGIDGFRWGRRYKALRGTPAYCTIYETISPSVLFSKAYLDRVNNPTPLTTRIMTGPFQNLSRTVCERVRARGRIVGSHLVTVRFDRIEHAAEDLYTWAETKMRNDLRAEHWQAIALPDSAVSTEEKLRGGDDKITACVTLSAVYEADAVTLAQLAEQKSGAAVGVYRQICELAREDM